jgi:hypothetical protein
VRLAARSLREAWSAPGLSSPEIEQLAAMVTVAACLVGTVIAAWRHARRGNSR